MKIRSIDVPLMVASLLLSLFLWVVVQVQLGAKTVVLHVPVRLVGKPDRVSVEGVPSTVDVETVATSEQSDWLDEHKTDFFAEVNLTGITNGSFRLPLTFRHPSSDLSFQPKVHSLRVTIDDYLTKQLQVAILLRGELPTDKEVWVSQTVRPSSVEVSGPAQLFKGARAVLEIDRSHYIDNKQIQAQVKLVDEKGDPIEGLSADRDTVTVTPLVEPVKSLPVQTPFQFTGAPAFGYHLGTLEFNTVQVRGPKKILEGLHAIILPAISLTGLSSTTKFFLIPELPKSVSLVSGKTVEVSVPIEPDTALSATPLLGSRVSGAGSLGPKPTSSKPNSNSQGNTVP